MALSSKLWLIGCTHLPFSVPGAQAIKIWLQENPVRGGAHFPMEKAVVRKEAYAGVLGVRGQVTDEEEKEERANNTALGYLRGYITLLFLWSVWDEGFCPFVKPILAMGDDVEIFEMSVDLAWQCSMISRGVDVIETGRSFSALFVSPFLKMGDTLTWDQSAVIAPCRRMRQNNMTWSIADTSVATHRNNLSVHYPVIWSMGLMHLQAIQQFLYSGCRDVEFLHAPVLPCYIQFYNGQKSWPQQLGVVNL